MIIHDKIRDEKLQYNIKRNAANKYHLYRLVKLINMYFLLVKNITIWSE